MEQTDEWWNELEKVLRILSPLFSLSFSLWKEIKFCYYYSQVAPKIKEQLTYAGSLMIGYQPLNHKNLKNFFRMVITCHPIRTYQHMDYVIEQIELWGEKI